MKIIKKLKFLNTVLLCALLTLLVSCDEKVSTELEGKLDNSTIDKSTLTADLVLSWQVFPQKPSIAVGEKIYLKVLANLIDDPDEDIDISSEITWTQVGEEILTQVGELDEAMFLAKSEGSTVLEGTIDNREDKKLTVEVTVGPKVVRAIKLNPDVSTIPVGTIHEYGLIGVYSDGSLIDIGNTATVTSSDTSLMEVSRVNGELRITAESMGEVELTVQLETGDSLPLNLTIDSAGVYDIEFSPSKRVLFTGEELTVSLTALISDETEETVTSGYTVESSNPGVLSYSEGKLTAIKDGTSVIEIKYENITRKLSYTVSSSNFISSIKITYPVEYADAEFPKGRNIPLTAYAVLSNGEEDIDLSPYVTWGLETDDGTFTISNDGQNGILTSAQIGDDRVTATYLGVTGSLDVESIAAIPDFLEVTSADPTSVPVGDVSTKFDANVVYTDGTKTDVSSLVTWTVEGFSGSTDPVLDTDGQVTATASAGSGDIKASYTLDSQLYEDTESFSVTSTLGSIEISLSGNDQFPADSAGLADPIDVSLGFTQTVQVEAVYGAVRQNVTGEAVWYLDYYSGGYGNHGYLDRSGFTNASTSIPFVSTSMGTIKIVVQYEGMTHEKDINVLVPTVAENGLTCSAVSPTVVSGSTTNISCSALFSDGSSEDAATINTAGNWDINWSAVSSNDASFPGSGSLDDDSDNATPVFTAANIGYTVVTATIDNGDGRNITTDLEIKVSSDCTGTLYGGSVNETDNLFCWHQGTPGQSCDAVCGAKGGYFNATEVFGESQTKCTDLITNVYNPGARVLGATAGGSGNDPSTLGCSVNEFSSFGTATYFVPNVSGEESSSASNTHMSRLCSCVN